MSSSNHTSNGHHHHSNGHHHPHESTGEQKIRERIERDLAGELSKQQSQMDRLQDQVKYWKDKVYFSILLSLVS